MGKEYPLAMRRQAILSAIENAGELSGGKLSEQLKVSEVTIRQDFQAFFRQNLLLLTHGGAPEDLVDGVRQRGVEVMVG